MVGCLEEYSALRFISRVRGTPSKIYIYFTFFKYIHTSSIYKYIFIVGKAMSKDIVWSGRHRSSAVRLLSVG
jgi:hypothetical protein